MKKLISVLSALILAITLASCSSDKNANTDGDVTSDAIQADTTEKASDDTTSAENADDVKTEEITDAKGNVIEQKKFDKNGNMIEKTENTYAGDGKLRSSTVSTYDGDKVSKEKLTFCSADGKENKVIERSYTYNKDGSVLISTDENGKKVSENLNDAKGNPISATSFNDSGSVKNNYKNGKIEKTESFGSDGKAVGYSEMKYDENGVAIGSETYSEKGDLLSKTVYEYEGDKVSRLLIYDADGTLARIGQYDSEGKLTMLDGDGNPVK